MTPHAFAKRHRSDSVDSASSSTSNKRFGSASAAATSQIAAMNLNAEDRRQAATGSSGTSSASTEPLMSEEDSQTTSATTEVQTGVQARHQPPEGASQLDMVLPPSEKPMQPGQDWYVVDRKWYRKWQAACGHIQDKDLDGITAEQVGPIDNSSFADPHTGRLIKPVTEGVNVVFLHSEAYYFLESWYGRTGEAVKREVIQAADGAVLDLTPPLITVALVVPSNSLVPEKPAMTIQTSSGWTLKELKDQIASQCQLQAGSSSRLWHLPENFANGTIPADQIQQSSLEPASDEDIIRSSMIRDNSRLAFEQANEDGTWLVQTADTAAKPLFGGSSSFFEQKEAQQASVGIKKRAVLTSTGLPSSDAASQPMSPSNSQNTRLLRSQVATSAKKGLVGLQNLGNTCFMNSALQCLSNTPSLQHYFHTGFYKSELNPDNPLGMGGEVAKAFGNLIEQIWSGSNSIAVPRQFKSTLSKFAPAFSGWQQHDSQELIAFLLDGLHEDLNRIKKKPYDDIPDWNGGGDKEEMELANVSWDLYKRRNDSVIVDLFQGQYRSRLTCPECSKIAIKFDPFMYLSLAIPSNRMWTSDVFLVPLDPKKPHIKVSLEVPYNSTFKQLKEKVGEITSYDPKRFFATEEWHSKFYKIWPDAAGVSELRTDDIVVFFELPYDISQPKYKIPNEKTPEEEGKIFVTVLHTKSHTKIYGSKVNTVFGEPFILALTAEEASDIETIETRLCERLEALQGIGTKVWATSPGSDDATNASQTDTEMQSTSTASSARRVIPDDEEMNDITQEPPRASHRTPNASLVTFTVAKSPLTSYNAQAFCEDPSDRITLRERLGSLTAGPSSGSSKPFAIPGSFAPMEDDTDELYGDDKPADSNAEASTSDEPARVAPRPLLRTGETITIEWNPRSAAELFGTDLEKRRTDQSERWSRVERLTDHQLAARRKLGSKKASAIGIEDLLDEFSKEEKLSEDNTWYCPSCKKHQQAQKKVDLWKLPDVLVFHLKRFSNERAFRDKIDTLIDFPIQGLDLGARVAGKAVAERLKEAGAPADLINEAGADDSAVYDLFAVDNHFGGLGGGHYTAYAKNILNGNWYNFDDTRVSPVSNPDDVKTAAAYLLFYCRRTNKPIGGKTHEILSSRTASPVPSIGDDHHNEDGHSFRTAMGSTGGAGLFRHHPEFINDHGVRLHSGLGQQSHAEPDALIEDEGYNDGSRPGTANAPSPTLSDDDEGNYGNRAASLTQAWTKSSSRPAAPDLHYGFGQRDDDLPAYSNEVIELQHPPSPPPVEIRIDSTLVRDLEPDSAAMDEVE